MRQAALKPGPVSVVKGGLREDPAELLVVILDDYTPQGYPRDAAARGALAGLARNSSRRALFSRPMKRAATSKSSGRSGTRRLHK